MDRSSLGLLIVLAACGPSVGTDGGSAEGDSSSTSSTTTGATLGTTTTTTSTTTTSADTSGSSSSEGSSSEGGSFIQDPDGGVCACCDVLAQDCGESGKCVPLGDGAEGCCPTVCVELVADPREVGEACTLLEPSGDDCELGALCWAPSVDAPDGVCVSICMGSRANLVCENECESCWVDDDAWTYVCLPGCDPLAPECPDGSGCYLGGETFGCVKDRSGASGAIWSACDETRDCDAGLACTAADGVTGCEVGRCCVPACDPLDPMACSDAPGGAATCIEVELAADVAACLPGARGLCG